MLAFVLAALMVAASPATTGTLDVSQIRETVFPSGLRLVMKESHATELAAVQVWIRAGGFLEDERTCGISHTIEHVIFKGSQTRGPGQIDAEIENLGGLLEASTEKDWSRFACTVNGRYVGKVLGVVADALQKPQFRAEDLQAEKPLIQEEIAQVALDPEANLSRALYLAAFQKHPYRLDARGIPRVVEQLKVEELRAWYQKHYTPSRMTVVVVGDIDPAAVERAVRTEFLADRPGPKPETPPLPEPEMAGSKPERAVVATDLASGFIGLAFPAPSVADQPDVYVMDLLLTLLEDGDGGRLPRALRGVGLVKATYETRRQPGLFTVMAATGTSDVEEVEALLRREISFLAAQPVPEAELSLAKRSLRGSYAQDNETYAGQAATLGYYASIDRWQFAADYLARVEAVTAEQVQATARKYLQADRSVAILLRPRGQRPSRPPRTGA